MRRTEPRTAKVLSGTGYTVGSPSSANVTIEDNDVLPAPSGVGKEVSDRTLTFSWNAVAGATSYSGLLTLPGVGVTQSCSATAPTTTCTFNDLTNGTAYSFKVRASRSGVDGLYSSTITATPTNPTVTLSGWMGVISAGEAPTFRVSISGLSKTRRYQLRLERENPGGAFGFVAGCATDLQNESIPSGSTVFSGGPYAMYGCSPTPLVAVGANTDVRAVVILADTGLQQRPCDNPTMAGCEWRYLHYEEVEVTPSIDVEPLPLRKVKLTWQHVPNADKYMVRVRDFGGSWTAYSPKPAMDSHLEISLDSIFGSGKSLADGDAYDFQVMAQDSGSSYQDSKYSDAITVIDTPIIEANGHSPGSKGQAKLSWRTMASVLGGPSYFGGAYSFRYRRAGGDHTQLTWRPGTYVSEETVDQSQMTGSNRDTIGGLKKKAIYAIQLRYEKTGKPKVYAARDVFVWPSGRPAHSETIGGFPLTDKPIISKTPAGDTAFYYRICEETFPANSPTTTSRSNWVNFTNHALPPMAARYKRLGRDDSRGRSEWEEPSLRRLYRFLGGNHDHLCSAPK